MKNLMPFYFIFCAIISYEIGSMSASVMDTADKLNLNMAIKTTIENVNMTLNKMSKESKDEDLNNEFKTLHENGIGKDSDPKKTITYLKEYNKKLLDISVNKKQD